MNKDDLLKLREQLANDKFTRISTENLPMDYIVVWDKSGGAELDDCPIYSGDYILNNKKSASEVVDTLVHNYAQAIYSFQQNGINDCLPIMSAEINLIYKFDQNMVEDDTTYDAQYIVVPEGTETLGDMVRLTDFGIDGDSIPWDFVKGKGTSSVEDLIKTKTLGEECFVSFNELLTELSNRGIYANYGDFQTIEKRPSPILDYSIEPLPQKEIKENKNK